MSLPDGFAARLAAGALLPLRAAGLLLGRRELWPLALAPTVLTLAGFVGGLAVAGPGSAWMLELAWSRPEGWAAAGWWLARVALFLTILYTAAVAVPVAVSAPFADRLSARVEALVLGPGPEEAGGLGRVLAETAAGGWHAAARVGLLLVGYAILAPSILIPGVWPVLAFLWTASWASFEWLDLPMARHLHGFAEVRATLRAVRPLGLGFGSVLGAIFLVPLANLVVIPIGAVAGTLLYCDLVESGRLARGGQGPAAR